MTAIPDWVHDFGSQLEEKMGIELIEVSADRVSARMPVDGNRQPLGLLHGGATGVLVECVGSMGALAHARTFGKVAVGTDLNVTHLRSVTAGHVTAVATATKLGRRMVVYNVDVRDDDGDLSATGRLTCMLVER